MVKSPEVLKHAREHYGCDSLTYLEFEN